MSSVPPIPTSPLAVPLSAAPPPATAEVVVVGCGLAGLLAAAALAERGVAVVAVDATRDLHRAGSLRTPGLLTPGLPEPLWRLVAAVGEERALTLLRLGQRSAEIIADLGVPTTDAWQIAIRPNERDELERSARALERLGIRGTWIDGDAARTETGIASAVAALRTPWDLAYDAGDLARAALHRATAAGARIVGGCAVRAIDDTPDGLRLRAELGEITAHAVLHAAGPGLAALEPRLDDRIVPVREHTLWLGPAPDGGGPRRAGLAMLGYVTFQPTPFGLAVSGCRWASPHLDVFERAPEPHDPRILDALHRTSDAHLGAGRERIGATAHITTHTCDGLPIVGPLPGDPTRVVCLGTQGYAAALAPALAEGLAAGLLDGASGLPSWLEPGRFL